MLSYKCFSWKLWTLLFLTTIIFKLNRNLWNRRGISITQKESHSEAKHKQKIRELSISDLSKNIKSKHSLVFKLKSFSKVQISYKIQFKPAFCKRIDMCLKIFKWKEGWEFFCIMCLWLWKMIREQPFTVKKTLES